MSDLFGRDLKERWLAEQGREPTAVGVHIFAGGFSVGVRQAGFEVACHLETSPYGVATAQTNIPGLPVFWPKSKWPLEDLEDEDVDFVYANPPCAVFSNMGVTHDAGPGSQAWRGDPRTSCWWDVLRTIERTSPRVGLLESVTQAYGTGRPLVDEFTRRGLDLGYSVSHVFVSTQWLGVSQVRRRFFLVFHRAARLDIEPVDFSKPAPPVGVVLARVSDPGPFSAPPELVPLARITPPKGSVSETYDQFHAASPTGAPRNAQGKRKGRPSFQDRRLDPDELSLVVAGDKLWHPSGERRLGTNEYKELCGYPQDFVVVGPQSGHASQLARAVMPPVGRWVALSALRTMLQPDDAGARQVWSYDLTAPGGRAVNLTAEYAPGGARSAPDPGLEPAEVPEKPGKASRPRPARVAGVAAAGGAPAAPALVEASEDPPREGEGSGRYMQRLLLAGVGGDECVRRVHQYFPGRTTKRGDAYYNYRKLQSAGLYPNLPPWRP